MQNLTYRGIVLPLFLATFALACNSKPTVIEKVDNHSHDNETKALVSDRGMDETPNNEVHKVVVQEVLNATRYTYLNVDEDGNTYWIAIPRMDVEKGATYYYAGGLLKRNFRSAEYNRMFETLVLVSNIREQPIFTGNSAVNTAFARLEGDEAPPQDGTITPPEDGISLDVLFKNMKDYEGKTVKVRGRCVKINKQIMGRNWVHIQDGTGGDEPHDLAVTTSADVAVGAVVTFSGTIALNKDFGAGYFYEIIMEDAHTHEQ